MQFFRINKIPILILFSFEYIFAHIWTCKETTPKHTHTDQFKTKVFSFLLQKNAKGQELFDQIVYHLDLVETDYFGLQFMDASQITVSIT